MYIQTNMYTYIQNGIWTKAISLLTSALQTTMWFYIEYGKAFQKIQISMDWQTV